MSTLVHLLDLHRHDDEILSQRRPITHLLLGVQILDLRPMCHLVPMAVLNDTHAFRIHPLRLKHQLARNKMPRLEQTCSMPGRV